MSALAPMAGTALSNARLFSELGRQQAELSSSEARYRLVSEAMQEGVWYWDVPSNKVEWNDRLLELMGVSRERWGGTFEDWFARLHPEDLIDLLSGVRVLVVDDDVEARDIASELLSASGAQVLAVASVLEALQQVATFRPQAVVSAQACVAHMVLILRMPKYSAQPLRPGQAVPGCGP